MIDQDLVLPEHSLTFFNIFFHFLILKEHVLTVSYLTKALRMINDSHLSAPVINAHLPTDQVSRWYCSDRRVFEIMVLVRQQLTSCLSCSFKE
jgi:hypothetical protein